MDKTRLPALFRLAFCSLIATFGFISTPAAGQDISDVIQWTDSLTLEESSDVLTVWPRVLIDHDGGFIVVDEPDHQVRLYDRDGNLRTYFGSQGEGPGEFSLPSSALRLPSGDLIVSDAGSHRTLTRFDDNGEFRGRGSRIFNGLISVHALPSEEEEVLVVGTTVGREPGSHSLLHRFNLETEEIIESFFPHPIPLGSYGNVLYGQGQIAVADVFDEHIVAAFNPLPKLYFFDVHGSPLDTMEVPLSHFRLLEDPGADALSSQEIFDYTLTWSKVSNVFWLDESTLLVQYYDVLDRDPWTTRWSLAAITRDGELLFEVTDTPRLFAVDRETGELFFSHPDHDFENYWKIGRLADHIGE